MKTNTSEILLVEDNPSDATLTIIALKDAKVGDTIRHLKDGNEALEYIFATGAYAKRKIKNTPGMILLDLKMPRVDGKEVLQKLKVDDRTKNIPIIVFTSSQEDRDVNDCYHLGVNSYVVKPVEFNKFEEVIKEIGKYWLLINYSQQ
jgi:two-component system, response regulator